MKLVCMVRYIRQIEPNSHVFARSNNQPPTQGSQGFSALDQSKHVSRVDFKDRLRDLVLGSLLILLFCSTSYAAENKALLIGISQYTELNSLRYADADALEFSQVLTDFAGYEKSDVTVLLNQQATKKRIVDEINKLVHESQKKPLDNFILMFAGHGVESTLSTRNVKEGSQNRETNIFLAPSDASTDENNFYSTGEGKEVSNETFINKAWLARQLSAIKAKSIIIILDSCYSGTKSFGKLFMENEGYAIESFGTTGSQNGVAVVQQRKLVLAQPGQSDGLANRKIAYLASSRDDQASAEYDELGHGALSYCIFEYIKRVQRGVNDDERQALSVDGVYTNITKLFHETEVRGKALDLAHQPILVPIPDFASTKDMTFVSVRGVKKREIQQVVIKKGILNIKTEPAGLEIYVDGEKREEVTNASLELTEGKHSIELFLPGTGYRYSFTTDISAASPVNENFSMRGKLEVASFWLNDGVKSPGPELDVYINGVPVGKSRLSMNNLLAGTHLIEVRYKNVTKSRHVEIRPDSPLLINYSVIREKVPKVDDTGVGNVVF